MLELAAAVECGNRTKLFNLSETKRNSFSNQNKRINKCRSSDESQILAVIYSQSFDKPESKVQVLMKSRVPLIQNGYWEWPMAEFGLRLSLKSNPITIEWE